VTYEGNRLISRKRKVFIPLRVFLLYMQLDRRFAWATPASVQEKIKPNQIMQQTVKVRARSETRLGQAHVGPNLTRSRPY
jgi:hypothetical protein